MKTITYTYDEENPTNRDYLIAALTDSIDDGGASHDSVLVYHIDCPYGSLAQYGLFANCLNKHEKNKYGTIEYADGCFRCKLSWLNRKYDTYPSDDGQWEVGAKNENHI